MKFKSLVALLFLFLCPTLFAQGTRINANNQINWSGSTVAWKIPVGDSEIFVSSSGSDSNDGLSWGSAKYTIMAAYDALPSQGGTIYMCAQGGDYVRATATAGQGIWIAGGPDPHYSSLPAGWRQAKPVSFIGSCGNNSNQQSAIPTVAIGPTGTQPAVFLWVSSSNINLDFENLQWNFPTQSSVQLGIDSNGNQTSASGVYGINFHNITTGLCNGTCASGAGPGWNIGGGDTLAVYMDHIVAQGNANATVGSDNQAAILIKPLGASNSTVSSVITDSVVEEGPIKFYEGTNGAVNVFKNIYSEGIAGGSNGLGTIWLQSAQISPITIQDIFSADFTGTVYDVENDTPAGNLGDQAQVIVSGVAPGGVKGPAVVLNITPVSPTDPLVQSQQGFWAGRVVGFMGDTQRAFTPSAVRWANLALQSSASWTATQTTGTTTYTQSITAPDGTSGAAQATNTAATRQALEFYSASNSIAVGDFFIGGFWERSENGGQFLDRSAIQNILITGTGNTSTCSRLYPGNSFSNEEWQWIYEICQVTAATTSPTTITFQGFFNNVITLQAYAPVLIHIPTGAVSIDEAYQIANSLSTYDTNCGVGTVCGFAGQRLVEPTFGTLSNCTSAASPAVCGSAAAGSVAVPTGSAPTLVVDTTAVTANSQILLTIDESLGTKLSVTCNTTAATLIQPFVTARTAGTSFTIEINATLATNPACVSYSIVN